MDQQQVRRFMLLFNGKQRPHYEWSWTEKTGLASVAFDSVLGEEQFKNHLLGDSGLGVVPLLDDGTCHFSACYVGEGTHAEIAATVSQHGWPLMVCSGMGGGVLLYLFGREPLNASKAISLLLKCGTSLYEGGVDTFPPERDLGVDENGYQPFGEWINLPYFNAEDSAMHATDSAGMAHTFDAFLDAAEGIAITGSQLDGLLKAASAASAAKVHAFCLDNGMSDGDASLPMAAQANPPPATQDSLDQTSMDDHAEAPPCIRRALHEKIGSRDRRDGIFHLTIYNKKRDPANVLELTHQMQSEVFEEPMPYGEAAKIIRSACKKTYRYLCTKSPWAGWCDKEACKSARYGISGTEYAELIAVTNLPEFGDLVMYSGTDPMQWELNIKGRAITLTTDSLFDYESIRRLAAEKLQIILPSKISNSKWTDEIIGPLMASVRTEETPPEAGPEGQLWFHMDEFLRRADLNEDGTDTEKRRALLRGHPVVQVICVDKKAKDKKVEKVVIFRGCDFMMYLKRNRIDFPKNKNLWVTVARQMGVRFTYVKVGQENVDVWVVRHDVITRDADREEQIKAEMDDDAQCGR